MSEDKSLESLEKNMSQPRPLGTLVMVKEHKAPDKTAGGLYVPDITKETQFLTTGTILAVGEGYWDNGQLIKPNVEVGQTVLYPRTSANYYKNDQTKEEFHFIPTGNLLAVLP